MVLRHHGGGVLTVKAFDASCCLWEFGAPAAEHLNNQIAVVVSPLGKFWRIGLEVNQSGMSPAGGWSEFLSFHGIIEGNVLLLKYQSNMVFTVKVFGPDGCQMQSKRKDTRIQQTPTLPDIEKQRESLSASAKKRKSKNERSSGERLKRPKGSMTSLDKASLRRKSVYEIGPQSWIKKEINKNTLEKHLSLSAAFCNVIGLREPCMIMLKNSMNSTRSWQVRCNPYKHCSYQIGSGWKRFCQDNRLKQGDVCTFNVIETTLWHVDIMRARVTLFSSMKSKCKNNSSSYEGQKWPKGSMNSLSKASLRPRCAYEIGPPSWIKKEINTSTHDNGLSLAPAFCDAIGFRKPCTITLKSSTNSTKSWQIGLGWKKFCQENRLKVGDICTFNVIKTTLWHVVIARR
ncbi:hypothetical protein PAHAL_7G104900 [Panicum hallii]|uniref:TF-B3 domain-containing protein n=1 Tax=Panicum hallii TaxID=206008 RepID=A0A2T8IBP2_9POAL|nr:hypothetical protein PAHAL_7G104900 [Panicum hallii]